MEAESEMIDLEMDAGNGAAPVDETDDEATEASAEPPPRPRVSLPERTDSRPEMPDERGPSPDQLGGDDGKILVIGQQIVFSGKLGSLDRLIVEGKVEAKIKDCRAIEIAETGHFKGHVEFERADIAGVFEGDLTAREHLWCARADALTARSSSAKSRSSVVARSSATFRSSSKARKPTGKARRRVRRRPQSPRPSARRPSNSQKGSVPEAPRVNRKTAPSPGTPSAHTRPPWRCTIRSTVASPSPLPENSVGLWSRAKTLKIISLSAWSKPIPLSRTW
jgi:hypothetical protein